MSSPSFDHPLFSTRPENTDLFQLSQFPVLDLEKGITILGSERRLKDMLFLMLTQSIDADKLKIEIAYAKKEWIKIGNLAHKIKGGAAYCGMVKMQMACDYLEHYPKEKEPTVLNQLYQQLIETIEITKKEVTDWLDKSPDTLRPK